jgi:hypothetical protein
MKKGETFLGGRVWEDGELLKSGMGEVDKKPL